MANIKQEIENPCFPKEFGDYLEANGFMKHNNIMFSKTYTKDDRAVVINADRASFRVYDEGDEEFPPEFSEQSCFEGLSALNINKWILLLHVAGIVPIKQFISNVRKLNPFNVVQMAETFFENVKTVCVVLLIACSILFCSCSTQHHVTGHGYQQTGILTATARGLHFEPIGEWEPYHQIHVSGDTVLRYADRLPRILNR